MALVGKLKRHRVPSCRNDRRIGRLGDVTGGILFTPEHRLAVMEGNVLAVVEPDPVETVLWIDPVGVDDLALALALQRHLAVAADRHHVILAAPQPQFAHVHPRLKHLAGPVGRGEAQLLARGVGALQGGERETRPGKGALLEQPRLDPCIDLGAVVPPGGEDRGRLALFEAERQP